MAVALTVAISSRRSDRAIFDAVGGLSNHSDRRGENQRAIRIGLPNFARLHIVAFLVAPPGGLFWILPRAQAAGLDPIDALRY